MAQDMTRPRRKKFGSYMLPSKAVHSLIEAGISKHDIDKFTVRELSEIDGFGKLAAKIVRRQRAVNKKYINRSEAKRVKKKKRKAPEMTRRHIEARTEETGYATQGRDEEFRRNHDNWLELPSGIDPAKASSTRYIEGEYLVLRVGPEHGLQKRHIQWINNAIRNAHPDLGIPNAERLITLLVRKAMQSDPSKGGTVGINRIQGNGMDADVMQDFTVKLNL